MKVVARILDQISKLKVKSVTDSLFKYGIYCFGMAVISIWLTERDWIAIVLFSFGGLFILAGLISYAFFALHNPDYLRSEEYQIKSKAADYIGDSERSKNTLI